MSEPLTPERVQELLDMLPGADEMILKLADRDWGYGVINVAELRALLLAYGKTCEWSSAWIASCNGRRIELELGPFCPFCGGKVVVK